MKHLLVDLGNTRMKWKLAGEGVMGASQPGEQFADVIARIHQHYPELEAISIVSVRDDVSNSWIVERVNALWDIDPYLASVAKVSCGVTCGYSNPALLGVDRWLAALAAYHLSGGEKVCVVDVGSATTVDVVNDKGIHEGGYIIPGLHLSVHSLLSGTSRINVEQDDFFSATLALGKNTQSAVLNGVLLTQVAFIESVVAALDVSQPGARVNLYITGGGAHLVKKCLSVKYHLVEDLVLQGLLLASRETSIGE